MPAHRVPLEIRFWQKVDKSDECWLWIGARHPLGYGHIKIDGQVASAHRVAYELARGAIPDGLVVDHLCRVPSCVNPEHLEAVTMTENTLRGFSPAAQAARRGHCERGHEYTPTNTYVWKGTRICRECRRRVVRGRKRANP